MKELDSDTLLIEYDKKDLEIRSAQQRRHRNMLHVSKPCVCGSLFHSRINHRDCLLNPKYSDAKEIR